MAWSQCPGLVPPGMSCKEWSDMQSHCTSLHFAPKCCAFCAPCSTQYWTPCALHFNLKSAFHRQYRTELCNFVMDSSILHYRKNHCSVNLIIWAEWPLTTVLVLRFPSSKYIHSLLSHHLCQTIRLPILKHVRSYPLQVEHLSEFFHRLIL